MTSNAAVLSHGTADPVDSAVRRLSDEFRDRLGAPFIRRTV
jgi:hypothetical protein